MPNNAAIPSFKFANDLPSLPSYGTCAGGFMPGACLFADGRSVIPSGNAQFDEFKAFESGMYAHLELSNYEDLIRDRNESGLRAKFEQDGVFSGDADVFISRLAATHALKEEAEANHKKSSITTGALIGTVLIPIPGVGTGIGALGGYVYSSYSSSSSPPPNRTRDTLAGAAAGTVLIPIPIVGTGLGALAGCAYSYWKR